MEIMAILTLNLKLCLADVNDTNPFNKLYPISFNATKCELYRHSLAHL